MRRRLVLPIAIGLGLTVGLFPIAAAYYLSRERAFAAERNHLKDYAGWTLQRADLAITRAKNGLHRLVMEQHELCSPSHLERLKQMTTEILSVEEFGTYRDGLLACDSWGLAKEPAPAPKPDIELPDAYSILLGATPGPQARTDGMLGVRYGPYLAHIKTERMIDVLHDTPMVLGLAVPDGRLVALSGPADPELIARLSREEASGTTDLKVFASVRGPEFMAFAISDRSVADWRADGELWKLLPFGLLISAIVIGLIVWASRQRMSLLGELRTGIHYREFVAHYQPIIQLADGRCVGAEALIRWPKPDGTWMRPDTFIPFAEQNHLIAPITDIIIERVLDDMKEALRADPSLHIAINISSEDIQSGRFLDLLTPALAKAGVKAPQIWLEATERGFMGPDAARATLERACELGHTVAIDDFGTGYSSLSLLESLPLQVLKIDKSFIDAIGRDAATSVVTPSIIDMAHSLKLALVAEGVETAEQADYLTKAGVEYAQGWFYAKALPPKEFLAFHKARNAAAPAPALAAS